MEYNYREEVKIDITNAIDEMEEYENATSEEAFDSKEEAYDYLYDRLWTDDSVTGNASGSYTFNTYKAEENICHNLELLGEALEEFGCDMDYLTKNGAEACDVTIRCYLLGEVLSEVLEERWEA